MKLFRLPYLLSLKASSSIQSRLPHSQRQRGASALEYIVLVGAIAVVLAAAVTVFGTRIDTFFADLMDSIFGPSSS